MPGLLGTSRFRFTECLGISIPTMIDDEPRIGTLVGQLNSITQLGGSYANIVALPETTEQLHRLDELRLQAKSLLGLRRMKYLPYALDVRAVLVTRDIGLETGRVRSSGNYRSNGGMI